MAVSPQVPTIVKELKARKVGEYLTSQGTVYHSRCVGLDDTGQRWQYDQRHCINEAACRMWIGPRTDFVKL